MSWSIPLGRVLGTEIRLHLTFLLLLAWIGLAHGLQGGTGQAVSGIVFICLLFGCVLLHEFGHVIAARRYGIATPDITLLPIGGVARLERIPRSPPRSWSWRWPAPR
jgi:stage IV sporulation protein FB